VELRFVEPSYAAKDDKVAAKPTSCSPVEPAVKGSGAAERFADKTATRTRRCRNNSCRHAAGCWQGPAIQPL